MTDFNPIEELRKAVDTLTATQMTAIWQEVDGQQVPTKVTLTPLIRELRDAVTSNIGSAGGGSALASERNIINLEALELYDAIERRILTEYSHVTTAVPWMMPEQNLRQWYIGFVNQHRSGKASDEALLEKLDTWSKWVRKIEDVLFPPTTLEVTAPCPMPECGKRWAVQSGNSVPAVVVEYREPTNKAGNALARSVARCRACGHVWRGDAKLRELRFLIDQAEEISAEGIA
jgi:hypothetical protein